MIDRIIIDNFKSIKHADVKLQKVNLLIGPNNSGKSNFLKIFETINKHTNDGGGIGAFHFYNKENKIADIHIHFSDWDIFLNGSNPISTEFYNPQTFEELRRAAIFFRSLKQSFIYKIQIDRLKIAAPLDLKADFINSTGDNIASFLQIALNKHRDIFSKITKDLNEFSSEFKEIVLDLLPSNQILVGLKDKQNRTFWADELSEGVLYFLCILCIINQPTPPAFLFIEEPETGIHPRRIKEVIDMIRKLSDEKDIQVIMTTHSPLVVDLFEDEPESIHVFEMKDGFTEIRNLKTDIIDPTNKELQKNGVNIDTDYGTSLGEKWVYGFLGGVPI